MESIKYMKPCLKFNKSSLYCLQTVNKTEGVTQIIWRRKRIDRDETRKAACYEIYEDNIIFFHPEGKCSRGDPHLFTRAA